MSVLLSVGIIFRTKVSNRPFPSCFEPHYESKAKCKVFVMKYIFHAYTNKPV